MGISIIIPTKNRNKIVLKTIKKALEILSKITSNYEIIVINDGNSDIVFNDPKVKIFKNKRNGVASARNLGVSKSMYDHLLFLDDDMLLTEDAAKHYINFLHDEIKSKQYCLNVHWQFPKELLIECKKSNFGRYLINMEYTDMKGLMKENNWVDNGEFIIPNLASYGLAITKENFNKVLGYNEDFPFAGFEDFDFSQRINKSGIKVLLNTQHVIFHNEEDRIFPLGWLKRRYNEGATRAVYVQKTGDTQFIIEHNLFKRIIYSLIHKIDFILLFITKFLNYKVFDFITFKIFKALEGAYIWKGYKKYAEKN